MRGDFSRITFRPSRHYSGVRLQQGRVQLDAEFNEQVDIAAYRDEKTTEDVVGQAGAPIEGGGFKIEAGSLLEAVGLAAEGDGWAVGRDGAILRFDSTQRKPWALVDPPAEAAEEANLRALRLRPLEGDREPDGIAVGEAGVVLVLTGPRWSAERSGTKEDLFDVELDGADAWAVGAKATVLRRTDSRWSKESVPAGVQATLRGVDFADGRGWAVGDAGTILATPDGSTWVEQESPAGTPTLHSVSFWNQADGVAVGDAATILETSDGGAKWKRVRPPQGVDAALLAVETNASGWALAVGKNGTILGRTEAGEWKQLPAQTDDDLHGVAVAESTAIAVGPNVVLSRGEAGFSIEPQPTEGRTLKASFGDFYLEGLRLENERTVGLTQQPDLPGFSLPAPPGDGPAVYGVYLEATEQHLSALEREELREIALGGPDTATRTRTLWQIKLTDPLPDSSTCRFDLPATVGGGLLRARAEPAALPASECMVPPDGGYRRLENQLYRVEVHDPSSASSLGSYKWSRENGSVAARLIAIEKPLGQETGSVTVSSVGRDENLGFAAQQIVELTDENRMLTGQVGVPVEVTGVRGDILDIKGAPLRELTLTDFPSHPTVRRWEGTRQIEAGKWLELESGVQVEFAHNGSNLAFRRGDYWTIPARTATGDVEWPEEGGTPSFEPSQAERVRRARLAVVSVDPAGRWSAKTDCRDLFPPLTALVEMRYVGGDGQEAKPPIPLTASSTIKLPQKLEVAVSNGRFPVVGATVVFSRLSGQGTFDGKTDDSVSPKTDENGVASCDWHVDGATLSQQAKATLVDPTEQAPPHEIHFTANLSVAAEVAYDPGSCPQLNGKTDVQAALSTMSRLAWMAPLSGTGFDALPADPPIPLAVLVLSGCGPVQGATVSFSVAAGNGTVENVQGTTDSAGIATCSWRLDAKTPTQELDAKLSAPGAGNVLHLPDTVRFVANLNLASDTAYTPPKNCPVFAGVDDVQEAITKLVLAPQLHALSGDGLTGHRGDVVNLVALATTKCGPFRSGSVVFELDAGATGGFVGPNPAPLSAAGIATIGYDPDENQRRQRIQAKLLDAAGNVVAPPVAFTVEMLPAAAVLYDRSVERCSFLAEQGVDNVQDAIDALCARGGTPDRPRLKLASVLMAGSPLTFGRVVAFTEIQQGIAVECASTISADVTLPDLACHVDIELPYALVDGDRAFWSLDEAHFAGEPIRLLADVMIEEDVVIWKPNDRTLGFLDAAVDKIAPITARLTIDGRMIWADAEDERLYLDAAVFAGPGGDATFGDGTPGSVGSIWFELVA